MKAFYFSVASACAAGVLMGGVMKLGPDSLADRPLGPQILLSGGANRVIDTDGWYADTVLASHNGEIPEYVIGTDWAQPAYVAVAYEPSYEPVSYEDEAARKAPPPATPAVYTHPQKPSKPDKPKLVSAPSYPSMDGDVLAHREENQPQVVSLDISEADTLTS